MPKTSLASDAFPFCKIDCCFVAFYPHSQSLSLCTSIVSGEGSVPLSNGSVPKVQSTKFIISEVFLFFVVETLMYTLH